MEDAMQSGIGKSAFDEVGSRLSAMETRISRTILNLLQSNHPNCDPTQCDGIFGIYTHEYLLPCIRFDLPSRAAGFGRLTLIPVVLELEQRLSTQFHKGALFYDIGLAHLLSGDEDGYEYFLALTDEEEFRKTGGAHKRGTANLRNGGLAEQTITLRMQVACDLLNGQIAGQAASYAYMTGRPTITAAQFDAWRQTLHPLHQFELLRVVHDVEVFLGINYPDYQAAKDNPFVMLRLAKALSHLAQWVESCLTHWQKFAVAETLGGKLQKDPDFGNSLSSAAGSKKLFAGKSQPGTDVVTELRKLLVDLTAAPAGAERQWRLLRILYIARNSTAHTIDPNLAMYKNRALLLSLLQVVSVSVFVISQLKAKPMP